MFSGNAYSNIFPSTSKHDSPDRCYYNFDESKLTPDTAISVEDLPDVVLQPEFREELDKQFDVSILRIKDFMNMVLIVFHQITFKTKVITVTDIPRLVRYF